jgi:hypothetical protein
MNYLESEAMPFRTLDKFYKPSGKVKTGEGIKVFPERQTNSKHTLSPHGELPSVCNWFVIQSSTFQVSTKPSSFPEKLATRTSTTPQSRDADVIAKG